MGESGRSRRRAKKAAVSRSKSSSARAPRKRSGEGGVGCVRRGIRLQLCQLDGKVLSRGNEKRGIPGPLFTASWQRGDQQLLLRVAERRRGEELVRKDRHQVQVRLQGAEADHACPEARKWLVRGG